MTNSLGNDTRSATIAVPDTARARSLTGLGARPGSAALRSGTITPDAAERLAAAVRFPTVSREDRSDQEPFLALHEFLRAAFPAVHRALGIEVVNERSLLFTWPGRAPAGPGVLLAAHLDVVPVEPATRAKWTKPPFEGVIADGHVWGRGTLDDKAAVLAILEAVERLVAAGFRPLRTVYLAFGHDEEVGGHQGARAISALLASRGVQLEWVLDEGLAVTDGLLPGVARPVALVGIAEKGRLLVELMASGEPGHAAVPAASAPTGRLAMAIERLGSHRMPSRLAGPARQLLEAIAPELPLAARLLVRNLWLTQGLVCRQLGRHPTTAALVRTTAAVTRLAAGEAANVLPAEARATVDLRVSPGEPVGSTVQRIRHVLSDLDVDVRVLDMHEASPVAAVDAEGYRGITRAIHTVFPEAAVAPGLVVMATDARHYRPLASAAYGFAPLRLDRAAVARIHGVDERIAVDNYAESIQFYAALIAAT